MHRIEGDHSMSDRMLWTTPASIHAKSLVPYRQCSAGRDSAVALLRMRSSVDTALEIYQSSRSNAKGFVCMSSKPLA